MSPPIPILFLHYGDEWLRGSEICLLQLLSRLDRQRFEPIVLCHAAPLRNALAAAGIESHGTAFPELMIDRGRLRLQFLRYARAWAETRRVLAGRRPALVYCNAGLASQLGSGISAWLRTPRLVHLHAPFYRRQYWLWGLASADELVFVSEATRRESFRRIPRPPPSRVIWNGVDGTRFHPGTAPDPNVRRKLGLAPGELVLAQVGSLIRRKGVDVLLDAFARLRAQRSARLLLVGEGADRAAFEARARELGVAGDVIFAGERTETERLWAHAIDVNVLASRMEALPLSLVEASACGVPSVATDVGGNAEVVEHGVTGLLVPAESPAALAEALERLAADASLRRSLGDAARARAIERFSIERYVADVELCIEDVLARRRHASASAATSTSA